MVAAPAEIASSLDSELGLELIRGSPARVLSPGPLGAMRVEDYCRQVNGLAALLGESAAQASHVLNLCENRYRFLVLLGAALTRGLPNLLPPSRAPNVVKEMLARYPSAIAIGDDRYADGVQLDALPERYISLPRQLPQGDAQRPVIAAEQLAVIGFTSGSSGPPKPQQKRWANFCLSTRRNLELIEGLAGTDAQAVATVPPQHMYGMETSVLMPLRGGLSIYQGRPFFPADIVAALSTLPGPRLLITTPVHLKALIDSDLLIPPLTLILSATAPLDPALAERAERRTGARVLELFGSTETCVVGYRQTANETDWRPHPGVRLKSIDDGTQVEAPWLDDPVVLHDRMELQADGGFRLIGRHTDHLEIAGKRASLGEINRRLLALPGVQDAVVFVPNPAAKVARLAALVVAPGACERELVNALRDSVDPVFLPRPLRLVDQLPRNETGKLPRQALLAALKIDESSA